MVDFIIIPGIDFTEVIAKSSRAEHYLRQEEGKTLISNEQVNDAMTFLRGKNFIVLTDEEVKAKLN